MVGALTTTLQTLASTENEAAVGLLLAALDSPQRPIQEGALRALLSRRSARAEAAVLMRWQSLSTYYRSLVAERTGWIAGAIRDAIASRDAHRFTCACSAAIATHDYDLIPSLVTIVQDKAHPHVVQAAETVLELAELLYEELAGPRDYRIRRDPQLQRAHVLVSLEKGVGTFAQHGRSELLEAFLLLANRDNAALKRTLQSPSDSNFAPLIEILTHNSRPGVVRLVLNYLDDPHAPLAVLQALARRQEITFLRQLFRRIGNEPSQAVKMNMKRIESIAWVSENIAVLASLGDNEQPGAVQLASCSGIPRRQAFEVIAFVLNFGTVAGRRAAALALGEFSGPDADELALATLADDDAQVRANIIRQLRLRSTPGALTHLLKLVDSPHQIEREAAQSCLEEFHFARYIAAFDGLSDEVRRSTGTLVKKIDSQTLPLLVAELESPARNRRKRGLEVAIAIDAVEQLHDAVAAILGDEDQFLRLEAVRALASCDSPSSRQALREALLDSCPLVQQAAERALSATKTLASETVPFGIPRETRTSAPWHDDLNETPPAVPLLDRRRERLGR